MALLPEAGNYKGKSGASITYPSRPGVYKALLKEVTFPNVRGSETRLNMVPVYDLKETVEGDKEMTVRGMHPAITDNYDLYPEDRKGFSKLLEVVDLMVSCGLDPAASIERISTFAEGRDFNSADDIGELKQFLSDIADEIKGKECGVKVTMDRKPSDSGIYNCRYQCITPEGLAQNLKVGAKLEWSDVEQARIAAGGRDAKGSRMSGAKSGRNAFTGKGGSTGDASVETAQSVVPPAEAKADPWEGEEALMD